MIRFNRDVFWKEVKARNALKGKITTDSIAGVNALFEAFLWCEQNNILDERLLRSDRVLAAAIANVIANVRREVGINMMPVFEGFKDNYRSSVAYVRANFAYGRPEGPYRLAYPGIGQIQLTHHANYKERGERLGLPLEEKPWEAIKLFNSARIAVSGMSDGSFRKGHYLARYSHEQGPDGYLGREMVNGDKAYSMKGYGTIGNFIEIVADTIFECLLVAMDHEPDVWDEGEPKLFPGDFVPEPTPGEPGEPERKPTMSFSLTRLLPMLIGGFGSMSSCTNVGSSTGTIAPDSALTQVAMGGPESIMMMVMGLIVTMLMNRGSNGNGVDLLKTFFGMMAKPAEDTEKPDSTVGRK